MNVPIQSYAACLVTPQYKIFKDLAKGTPIKKGPCVVVMQELECIINLHMKYAFLDNNYSCPACGGFLCLELSSEYILVI